MKQSFLLWILSATIILSACGSGTDLDIKKQGSGNLCEGICPTPTPTPTPIPTPTLEVTDDSESIKGLKALQEATGADENLIIAEANKYQFDDLTQLDLNNNTIQFLLSVSSDLNTKMMNLQKLNDAVKLYVGTYQGDELIDEAEAIAKSSIKVKLELLPLLKLVTGLDLKDLLLEKLSNGEKLDITSPLDWQKEYFPADPTEDEIVEDQNLKDVILSIFAALANYAQLIYIAPHASFLLDDQCYSFFYFASDPIKNDGLYGVPNIVKCEDNLFRLYHKKSN